jgi:hypothetical protein
MEKHCGRWNNPPHEPAPQAEEVAVPKERPIIDYRQPRPDPRYRELLRAFWWIAWFFVAGVILSLIANLR